MHGSAADWTVPEWVSLVGGPRWLRSSHLLWAVEQLEAERQQRSTIAVGEETEVADAHEAGRQQVEQEAAQELIHIQSHEPFLVAVGGIAPTKGDVAVGESDQPGVGDSHAMSVGAEIAQYMFRSAEWALGVDDPVMAEQYPQPCSEGARLS